MSIRPTSNSALVSAIAGASRHPRHGQVVIRASGGGFSQASRSLATATHPSESNAASNSRDGNQRNANSAQSPDASTLLLLETIPRIPRYGFTKQAYLHRSSTLDVGEMSKRMRIAETLFPGPEATFDGRLFAAWNRVCDTATVQGLSPEQVMQSLKVGEQVGTEDEGKPVRMQKSLSQQEEKVALENVASLIEERLRLSWAVKSHLTHGITALSTSSPTTSKLHSIFPHQTILPNLPNPEPLLDLSSTFVSMALTHPSAQKRTGWIDPDGPEWYAIRCRLTLAYTAATLHAASPSIAHFQDTQKLFYRIVRARDTGLAATLGSLAQSAGEWTKWGGRGWLGVLRSLGL